MVVMVLHFDFSGYTVEVQRSIKNVFFVNPVVPRAACPQLGGEQALPLDKWIGNLGVNG